MEAAEAVRTWTRKACAQKGRPREFCVDQALAAALRVFWSRGYEGASMAELTEAMGVTKPSLYAAFGNKEALFRKALDLYEAEKMAYVGEALALPTARAVVERMLRGAIENLTGTGQPHGCLRVISSVACGAEAESIRAEVLERGNFVRAAIVERFERARVEGDLPSAVDIDGMTSCVQATIQGMALQAGAGASRDDLLRLAGSFMAMWPGG